MLKSKLLLILYILKDKYDEKNVHCMKKNVKKYLYNQKVDKIIRLN